MTATDDYPRVGDKYRRGNITREVLHLVGTHEAFIVQSAPNKHNYYLTISVETLLKWERVE